MVLKQKDDALKSFKNLTRLPERVDSSFQSIQKDTTLDGFQVIEEKRVDENGNITELNKGNIEKK